MGSWEIVKSIVGTKFRRNFYIFKREINQSIIYLFSKEKTIINKYNEIKLNKTNKTLRNNLAYYLL